jgi:hypothetical protein
MKILFALILVSTTASAQHAELLKCRQLEDGPVRLACYNAIPANAAAPVAAATVTPVAATVSNTAASAPSYDTVAAPTRAQLEQMFGQEPPMLRSVRLNAFDSTIAGRFDGWVPGQRIRLANGQVWKVVDGSEDIMDARDPKVTVKRGLLGAIFLDIDGAHRLAKVRREQ